MAAALSSNEERDWMWLPDIVMASVSSYLFSSHDYVRFSCVCKRWHSVAKEHKQRHMATVVSFLLVPPKTYSNQWSAYGVTQRQPCEFKLTIPYRRQTCCGSSHGWLAFLGKDLRCVTLFNPFTKSQISLPALTDSTNVDFSNRGRLLVRNVVLSANPCLYGNDYMVAAIIQLHRDRDRDRDEYYMLALIRPGRDEKWTHRKTGRSMTGDMIFDKNGKLIFATATKLVHANIKFPFESTKWKMVGLPGDRDDRWWLLEASRSGDPLIISSPFLAGEQTRRKVFELRGSSFVEVDDLNGDAILVGKSYVEAKNVRLRSRFSSRVAARDFQGIIEPNCVYVFYHDRPGNCYKFNVKQGKFDPVSRGTVLGKGSSPFGIWISPTINL